MGVYTILLGIWVSLPWLLAPGIAGNAGLIVFGIIVVGAYLMLLVRHVRRAMGNRASMAVQLGSTVGEALMLLAAFAWVYRELGILDNTQPGAPPVHDYWRALYLSFITATTVGYGDFYPTGAGRALAALQGLTGYLVLGILASSAAALISPQAPEGPHDGDGDSAG